MREELGFLVTNRIPRRLCTHLMGWFSRIEQPIVRDISLFLWRLMADLNLHEARTTRFRSLHDCFTRELKEGVRPIDTDPRVLVSPCDGIVGASGRVEGTRLYQAKGFPYALAELLLDSELEARYRDGIYVTLRLKSSMYHRFHAPHDCRVERVTYISGDTWNVHPIALERVEKLFCRNERALVRARLDIGGDVVTLVPVAAVLVASLRLNFLDVVLHLNYRGPNVIACDVRLRKGDEMGRFEHGSTIIVFAPRGFSLSEGVTTGRTIRMGEPLLRLPHSVETDL